MEWFAWLGDGISDAAQRHLKKMLPLPGCASPGMMGPETWHSGSSAGIRAVLWDSKTLAWVKDQTDGLSTLCPGCPSPAPAWHHVLPVLLQHLLVTAGQTHARPAAWPSCGHAQCEHTHTHTCTHVCTHKLITFPSLWRLLRPRRSLISLSEHPSSPSGSSAEAGKRWTRAGGSACRTARASALAVLPPPRQGNQRNPQKLQPRTRATTAAHLRMPWGWSGETGRKLSSSYPLPRGNQPETRVNRKAKKSPGEGGLPVGGRGRLEDRGESEEACLSWRQGGSPS